MPCKVTSNSFTSCTLAPLATNDSGTPRASTSRLLLRPFFSPIRGVGAHAFDGQRSLSQASIQALPAPGDALHLIVLSQAGLPNLQEKAFSLPLLEVSVHGAGAAKLPGQCLPLTAGAQHIDNGRKNLPRGHRLSAPSGLAPVLAVRRPFPHRNQQLNLAPQHVRHCPRLYLCHLEPYLRPVPHAPDNRIVRGNQPVYYLRISS